MTIESAYKKMKLIRLFEQKMEQLFVDGYLNGTIHSCEGQEAIAVAVADALSERDIVVGNHRSHGHYLALFEDVKGLMAELMGLEKGVVGGRGGSQHLFAGQRFYTNGVQGSMIAPAAGMAYAEKVNNTGNIVVCFIGDGTLGQGIVYETMNLAVLFSAPMLIILENNQYAMSTSVGNAVSGSIQERARAFGMYSRELQPESFEQLQLEMNNMVQFVRMEQKPAFFVIETYRFSGHSKSDDRSYRTKDEEEYWLSKDLLGELGSHLKESDRIRIETECRKIIENAWEKLKKQ